MMKEDYAIDCRGDEMKRGPSNTPDTWSTGEVLGDDAGLVSMVLLLRGQMPEKV